MLEIVNNQKTPTIIKVIGVGGAGMNAVNRMIHANLEGVEFIAINTDEQVLGLSKASQCISIGQKTTRGMGAGGDPELGYRSAMEDQDKIAQALSGSDMVFITAGMGGGTGTGAAPIVAQIARNLGALVVGVVTVPFQMEGARRMSYAQKGLDVLRDNVDTLITIKNDSIFKMIDKTTPVDIAFRTIDDILLNAVRGISDLINRVGLVNVDFADVRSVMSSSGEAVLGAGEGFGEDRATKAVDQAIHNALLEETGIEGATSALINVCASQDLAMFEWNQLTQQITQHLDAEANIIIGLSIEPSLNEKIRVTVIATGFSQDSKQRVQAKKLASVGKNQSHWSNFNSLSMKGADGIGGGTQFETPSMLSQRQKSRNSLERPTIQEPLFSHTSPKAENGEDAFDEPIESSFHPHSNITSEEFYALNEPHIEPVGKKNSYSSRNLSGNLPRKVLTNDLEIPAFLRRR